MGSPGKESDETIYFLLDTSSIEVMSICIVDYANR